jgi:threonine/homoserine/homoserine lactone efflux protein
MQYLPLIITITSIHLLAVMSPGPDFIVAVKNSLSYSRKTGIWTALWFALGISVHMMYCIAWIAILISQSIIIFSIIKLLWAGYLIYIWVMSLLSKSSHIDIGKNTHKTDISPTQAVKIWFFTNILNPKVTLFFLSLFTFVISPDTPVMILWIISFVMIINTFLWFSLVSIFLTQKKIRTIFERYIWVFNKIFWVLLIGIGLKVALIQK